MPVSKVERNKLRRDQIGFVFQYHFLIEYLSIFENIMVGSDGNFKKSAQKIKAVVEELGLSSLMHRRIDQLSQGQKQRVTIARALANQPKIVFVDEPTSNLDHTTGKKVIKLFEKLAETTCVVIVTHDETNLTNAEYVFSIWDGQIHGLGSPARARPNISSEQSRPPVS